MEDSRSGGGSKTPVRSVTSMNAIRTACKPDDHAAPTTSMASLQTKAPSWRGAAPRATAERRSRSRSRVGAPAPNRRCSDMISANVSFEPSQSSKIDRRELDPIAPRVASKGLLPPAGSRRRGGRPWPPELRRRRSGSARSRAGCARLLSTYAALATRKNPSARRGTARHAHDVKGTCDMDGPRRFAGADWMPSPWLSW